MDAVYGDARPPAELTLAWQCERYKALPKSGGLLDQDYRQMHLMAVTVNVYNAVSHLREYTGERIHQLPESERLILRMLQDNGIPFI